MLSIMRTRTDMMCASARGGISSSLLPCLIWDSRSALMRLVIATIKAYRYMYLGTCVCVHVLPCARHQRDRPSMCVASYLIIHFNLDLATSS